MFEAVMTPTFTQPRPWLIPLYPASDARLQAMRRQLDAAEIGTDYDWYHELFEATWHGLDQEDWERFEHLQETTTGGKSRS